MNEPQVLLDMPVLLVILLALVGGVFGEMWRADKDGASGWLLIRRLALRSGDRVGGHVLVRLVVGSGALGQTSGAESAPLPLVFIALALPRSVASRRTASSRECTVD